MADESQTQISKIALYGYCESCQAPSGISISLDSRACERCGGPLQVNSDVAKTLTDLQSRLVNTPIRKHQFLAQEKGGYGPKLNAIASAFPWIIAGCWPFLLSTFQHEDILGLLTRTSLSTPFEKIIWWTIYLPITGFTINYFLDRLSDRISADIVPEALPITRKSESPRCRLCHAPIPNGGIIRRCMQCMADNLMQELPEGKNKRTKPILAQQSIPHLRQQEELADSIARHASKLPWIYLLLSPTPLLMITYFPTTSLPTHPICWLLPAFLLAIGVYYAVSSKEAEFIQSGGLSIPAPGDQVELEDGDWVVRFAIISPKPLIKGWNKQGSQTILLISRNNRDEPTHALLVHWRNESLIETIRYQLNTVAKIHQETTEEWDHSVIVHLFSEPRQGKRQEPIIAKLNWHLEGARIMPSGAPDQEVSVPEQLWLSIADPMDNLGRELTLEQPETLYRGIRSGKKQ